MSAETLRCPNCGASASTDSTQCSYCGAALATVACPSCFGMMFVGSKFCSHCGAKADRVEVTAPEKQLCPRCQVDMGAVVVGKTHLRECAKCEGLWADVESLKQICTEREQQAAILGMPSESLTDAVPETTIRYLPCPVCHKLMNRVNFARCSHVIVDVCKQHGTWFDKDELRHVVEFIRAGGFEKARGRELADIEDQRQRLRAQQNSILPFDADASAYMGYANPQSHTSAAVDIADFLLSLFE